jgi:hypothetical protein
MTLIEGVVFPYVREAALPGHLESSSASANSPIGFRLAAGILVRSGEGSSFGDHLFGCLGAGTNPLGRTQFERETS